MENLAQGDRNVRQAEGEKEAGGFDHFTPKYSSKGLWGVYLCVVHVLYMLPWVTKNYKQKKKLQDI